MEQQRWSALQTILATEPRLSPIFADRVGFLRIPKDMARNKPYIVFNEAEWSGEHFANGGHEKGIDMFQVLIDVVVPYEQLATGRKARNIIRAILSGINGQLSTERSGQIVFQKFLEIGYDVETDNILLGAVYLFKEHYDYTG